MKSNPEQDRRLVIGNLDLQPIEIDDRFVAPRRQPSPPDFADQIKAASHKTGETTQHVSAVHELKRHIAEIEGEHEGADPSDYLSPQEVETLAEYHNVFDALNWPNSDEITLREPSKRLNLGRLGVHKTWRRNNSKIIGSLKGKALERFYPRKGPTTRGYVIGTLSVRLGGNHIPIAYCSDGKLRSLRGEEFGGGQTAFGWGSLPEPKILKAAMGRGSNAYGVYTGALPLSKRLNDKIKSYL